MWARPNDSKYMRVLMVVALSMVPLLACTEKASPARSDQARPTPSPPPLQLPDLANAADSVRDQLRDRFATLNTLRAAPDTSPQALAAAYGEIGKLLLAGGYTSAGAIAFRNAEAVEPANSLWPYLLGRAYEEGNNPAQAIIAFSRARDLDPLDVTTLVRLGEVQMAAGHPEAALEPMQAALRQAPGHARALASLARAELALRDYANAVRHFEQALAAAPYASRLHYQLSLAYRALGDTVRADAELRKRGSADVAMSDPRLEQVAGTIESAMAFDMRSREALARGRWAEAIAEAQRGLEVVGPNPSLRATLHHRVGTALAQTGDQAGARREFQQAVDIQPDFAAGHYSLAVLLASASGAEALREFSEALKSDPTYVAARLGRADLLRQARRPDEALREYRQVLESQPNLPAARFGEALALTALNRPDEALAGLEKATAAHPDDISLTLVLARLLAGAPRAELRQPARALALADQAARRQLSFDAVETVAFALAANSRFDEAIAGEEQAIQEARRQRADAMAKAMTETLHYYQRRQMPPRLWMSDPLYQPTR